MIKQTFYMVWVEGANNPVFRHSTIEGAETEAKRLAEMTGSKAYVLCSIKSVELSKFKIEDCRPEGDDLPF